MGGKDKKIITLAVAAAFSLILFARPQERPEDKLVRLVKARSVNMVTSDDGKSFRKAIDATFFHNDTYLICDTAYWWVDEELINAIGNVQLTQDGTTLTSEKLDYLIDKDLAQFRGGVVQLIDKENNTLRTHYLDYNTADSVAVFFNGASFKDKDGQIIESLDGNYDSKAKRFTFEKNVNMFTDSIFIRTNALDYHTDTQKADFRTDIDFWKDDNMLSSSRGWYKREEETFFFTGRVHATTKDYETWCDTLFYYRTFNDIDMYGNVQLQDSVNRTSAVASHLYYQDSLAQVILHRDAAVAMVPDAQAPADTVYFGADTLVYYTLRYCDIPEGVVSAAKSRYSEINTDPVGEYRRQAAEAAAKAAEEAKAKAAGTRPGLGPKQKGPEPEVPVADNTPVVPVDSVSVATDSTALVAPVDSTALSAPLDSLGAVNAPADSLAAPSSDSLAVVQPEPDTTRYGFAIGLGNVKIFRKDIQVRCDSMRYSDLDSIARFYKEPVIWNEGRRQYYSDSLAVLVRDQRMERASLMSNAFVVTQEDSLLYDQIRGAEIMAYFDTTSALKRFDALGGALAVFFLRENDKLATVNKVESKMLSGNFVDGDVDRVYYYDTPKNDAYPVVQFPENERYIKGFKWTPERRPSGKRDITTLEVRKSERSAYEKHPRAQFKQTDRYFPGYIKSVYASIEANKMARARADREKRMREDEALVNADSTVVADSLNNMDSLSVKDSVLKDSLAVKDSLMVSDSTVVDKPARKSLIQKIKDKFAQWRAAREKRWEELDKRDAEKAAAKKEKELQKKREKTRKELIERQKQEQKEQEQLNRYIEYYEKRKNNGKVD